MIRHAVVAVLLVVGTAHAAAPKAPTVKARGYVLQDFTTGKILAEQNADERLEPASLTKIMTS